MGRNKYTKDIKITADNRFWSCGVVHDTFDSAFDKCIEKNNMQENDWCDLFLETYTGTYEDAFKNNAYIPGNREFLRQIVEQEIKWREMKGQV